MSLPIEQFDYDLPEELIAQEPMHPRDHSRLMVVDRKNSKIGHCQFFDVLDLLKEGDVLVMNNSRVFKARLQAKVRDMMLEVILLRHDNGVWQALVKRSRRLKIGEMIHFEGMFAEVLSRNIESGVIELKIDVDVERVLEIADEIGDAPLPPYIEKPIDDLEDYQTVYANDVGSVAAPTAGLHFTPELIERLQHKGVQIAYITLHVGIGTFQPIWVEDLEDHEMHQEFVQITEETALVINQAKKEGRRVVSVGTTSTRALEGAALGGRLPELGFVGDVNIFIKPGYEFQIIEGMITNFHLPRTTLLALVSAFAGHDFMMSAYEEAINKKYRFYSFGDVMIIL